MYRRRRVVFLILMAIGLFAGIFYYQKEIPEPVDIGQTETTVSVETPSSSQAIEMLQKLSIKGRAPKTGYSRSQFGNGWVIKEGCDTRNTILARDLIDVKIGEDCKVDSGTLNDPYTGTVIKFVRGSKSSADVQIDHVVALSNAWQTGAQQLSEADRISLANDPLNLLAVSGPENQIKSDGDSATWLPKYKPFRCQYVTRQIQIKHRYNLWVTSTEKETMLTVLQKCAG